MRIEVVESNPYREDSDAHDNGFPTEFPAHFRNGRPDCPKHHHASDSFAEVKPVARGFAELSLKKGEDEKDRERNDAEGSGRVG